MGFQVGMQCKLQNGMSSILVAVILCFEHDQIIYTAKMEMVLGFWMKYIKSKHNILSINIYYIKYKIGSKILNLYVSL